MISTKNEWIFVQIVTRESLLKSPALWPLSRLLSNQDRLHEISMQKNSSKPQRVMKLPSGRYSKPYWTFLASPRPTRTNEFLSNLAKKKSQIVRLLDRNLCVNWQRTLPIFAMIDASIISNWDFFDRNSTDMCKGTKTCLIVSISVRFMIKWFSIQSSLPVRPFETSPAKFEESTPVSVTISST